MGPRHSPCVGICTLETTTGICLGCGRSRDEIAQWMLLTEDERDQVWSHLPARLAKLNIGVRLLPWTGEEIIGFIVQSLSERRGLWSLGPDGAAARFHLPPTEGMHVEVTGNSVVAKTGAALLRIRIGDKVRAFAFTADRRIVLALPTARAKVDRTFTASDPQHDGDAIDDMARKIIKLEGGDQNFRWYARSENPKVIDRLKAVPQLRLQDLERAATSDPSLAGATIVCETAIGSIEFLPGSKVAAIDAGETLAIAARADKLPRLPPFAAPVATFHPQYLNDG